MCFGLPSSCLPSSLPTLPTGRQAAGRRLRSSHFVLLIHPTEKPFTPKAPCIAWLILVLQPLDILLPIGEKGAYFLKISMISPNLRSPQPFSLSRFCGRVVVWLFSSPPSEPPEMNSGQVVPIFRKDSEGAIISKVASQALCPASGNSV